VIQVPGWSRFLRTILGRSRVRRREDQMIIPRVSAQFMETEKAAELYCDEVLTGDGHLVILDRTRSVSGPIRFDLVPSLSARQARIHLLKGVHHGC